MRLFVAILLDEKMKRSLRAIQNGFRRRGVEGNYSPEENLHLTLAFIGEYPDPDAVLEAMASLRFAPVELKLSGVGAFDDLWWAGLEESEQLAALARSVRHALADASIPFDRKRFRPHNTLLRRARFPGGRSVGEIPAPQASMSALRVSLMLSTRGRGGMIYTELGSVPARPAEEGEGSDG